MIGRRLKDLQTTNPPKEPNAYLTWINNYVADDYTEAVRTGRGEDIFSTLKMPWSEMLTQVHSASREACCASVAQANRRTG